MNAWMAVMVGGLIGFLLGWYIERTVRFAYRICAYAKRHGLTGLVQKITFLVTVRTPMT